MRLLPIWHSQSYTVIFILLIAPRKYSIRIENTIIRIQNTIIRIENTIIRIENNYKNRKHKPSINFRFWYKGDPSQASTLSTERERERERVSKQISKRDIYTLKREHAHIYT